MNCFISFALVCLLSVCVKGHGNMVEPPSRAVMHDYGFPDNPRDSNWNQNYCGGKWYQWGSQGGKCGICGDPWDAAVKEHEAPGGKFANGVIVRRYQPGQVITVTSDITANHVGFVEWRLCPNNNIHQDPDQDCFDRPDAALVLVETGETKLWVTDAMGTGKITTQVRLPMWECEQCVLQWTYRNGRDWGTCNGECGEVETFRGCADIAIGSGNNVPTTAKTTTTDQCQCQCP